MIPMAKPQQISATIELLKREKDLEWMFETMPDWKIFQLVSLVITHHERVVEQDARKTK